MVGFSTMSHIKEIDVQIDINKPYTCSEFGFSIVTPRYIQPTATRRRHISSTRTLHPFRTSFECALLYSV